MMMSRITDSHPMLTAEQLTEVTRTFGGERSVHCRHRALTATRTIGASEYACVDCIYIASFWWKAFPKVMRQIWLLERELLELIDCPTLGTCPHIHSPSQTHIHFSTTPPPKHLPYFSLDMATTLSTSAKNAIKWSQNEPVTIAMCLDWPTLHAAVFSLMVKLF